MLTGRPLSEPAVCEEEFGNDREVDLRKIKGYQFPEMKHYSKFIFPQNYESSNTGSHKPGFPVADHVTVPTIVTGADYSHFKESLDLIRNMNNGVRKAYKDMDLVYFDLGLSRYQRQEVSIL